MNKAEYIDALSAKTGFSKKDLKIMVEASHDLITSTLANKESISFIGFGTYSTSERAARIARVPGTGAEVNVPATTVAKFKPGKALKEAVKK